MKNFLLVGAGGFFGAMSRYGMGLVVARYWTGDFPLATLLINVSGSFILGLFMTLATERAAVDPALRLLVATGFIGAYTTFSTFEYETHQLTETGTMWWAAANVAASVLIGFGAVRLGIALAR
jgi:CrcB protein